MQRKKGLKKEIIKLLLKDYSDKSIFSPREIIAKIPEYTTKQSYHATLSALCKEGFLERISNGVYRLTDASRPSKIDGPSISKEPKEPKEPKEDLSYAEIGKAIEARLKDLNERLKERDKEIASLQSTLRSLQEHYNELKLREPRGAVSASFLGINLGTSKVDGV